MLHADAVPAGTLDLLKRVTDLPALSAFRLVGGTALALQIGHRLSYDLDFFCDAKANLLAAEYELLAIDGMRLKASSSYALFLECSGVKIDVLNYPGTFLHPPLVVDHIRMANKADIAVMKMKTVMNRGARRDFYDLFFLLDEFTLEELILPFANHYPNVDLAGVFKSLVYFADAEDDEPPVLLSNKTVTWEEVKEKLASETYKLL